MKIGIIGAGITGLAAAYDLSNAGHSVTMFEASADIGGLASGFKDKGWSWSVEKYYHHWFESDSDILGLIDELGQSHKIIFPRPISVVYFKGEFYPLDSVSSVFKFPAFNLVDTIRFGAVTAYLKYLANWQSLESKTATSWLTKYYGKNIYQILWQPLLEGKFGPFLGQVNMAWMWARLKVRSPKLGTYTGGFQTFINDLVKQLESNQVKIHTDSPILKVETVNQSIKIIVNSKSHTFDKVLVTTSPGILAKITPDLPKQYLNGLKSLKSLGAVVVTFALKHQLSEKGYYWFNLPKSAGFPYLALVEHTNYVKSQHFNGDHIVYCGDYQLSNHKYFKLSNQQIIELFSKSLSKINPRFKPNWIRKAWVYKAPYAQPVPHLNHSKRVPNIRTPLNNLYFASMSQVYPWDRGTNFAVRIGRQAASLMME